MRSRKRAAEKRKTSGSFHLAAYSLPPSPIFPQEQVHLAFMRGCSLFLYLSNNFFLPDLLNLKLLQCTFGLVRWYESLMVGFLISRNVKYIIMKIDYESVNNVIIKLL